MFAADDDQSLVSPMNSLPSENIVQNVTAHPDSPAVRQSVSVDRQSTAGQSRILNSSVAMVAIPPPGLSVKIRSTTKGKKITMDTYCEQLVQIGFMLQTAKHKDNVNLISTLMTRTTVLSTRLIRNL